MGLALDTILAAATNPGAGPTAMTAANGDSFGVRALNSGAKAYLDMITRQGATAGFVQVRSPKMHDSTQGIRVTPGDTPSAFALPGDIRQPLFQLDVLTVECSGGAAETDVAALHTYYEDTPGSAATLISPGDLAGNVANVKPIRIAVTSSATAGQWADTVITATEDLTKANEDYAVIGYTTQTALAVVGLKGPNTGNMRACGPGALIGLDTTNYFYNMSEQLGVPYIPVFNQANKNGTFVSVAAATASVVAVVELICVELVNRVTK